MFYFKGSRLEPDEFSSKKSGPDLAETGTPGVEYFGSEAVFFAAAGGGQ